MALCNAGPGFPISTESSFLERSTDAETGLSRSVGNSWCWDDGASCRHETAVRAARWGTGFKGRARTVRRRARGGTEGSQSARLCRWTEARDASLGKAAALGAGRHSAGRHRRMVPHGRMLRVHGQACRAVRGVSFSSDMGMVSLGKSRMHSGQPDRLSTYCRHCLTPMPIAADSC